MTEPTEAMIDDCPHCGATIKQPPQNSDRRLSDGEGWWVFIWCENCDAQGGARKTEAEAISAWNAARPSEPTDFSGYYEVHEPSVSGDVVERAARAVWQVLHPTGTSWEDWEAQMARNPDSFDGRDESRRIATAALEAANLAERGRDDG